MEVAELRRMLWPRDFPDLRRHGRAGDGGYVVPSSALLRADALLSFGLGFDWSFERAFAAMHPGAAIHVYDPTVGTRRYVTAGLWALLGAIYSRREWAKFRACCDYFAFFAPPVRHIRERIGAGAGQVGVVAALESLGAVHRIVLKADVEGAEYEILDQIVALRERIEVLVIEFHQIAAHVRAIADFVSALRATHVVAHLHGNNYSPACADGLLPTSIEVVFAPPIAPEMAAFGGALPRTGLDYPNTLKRPELVIARP
jgi:hypothetical protein